MADCFVGSPSSLRLLLLLLLLLVERLRVSSSQRVAIDCDANPGALPATVRELRQARASYKNGTDAAMAPVLELAGDCQLDQPLTLGPADGGVLWRTGPKGATISGGTAVVGWEPAAGSAMELEADVAAWPRAIKSLRVGELRRERSRFPTRTAQRYKTGWLFAQPLSAGVATPDAHTCVWCNQTLCTGAPPPTAHCWLGLDPTKVARDVLSSMRTSNSTWLNVFGTGEADVLNMLLPVLDVNVNATAIKIPILPYDGRGGFHLYQRLWLENVPTRVPLGEFFFDASKKRLRYHPVDPQERAALLHGTLRAVAPLTDVLLDLNGTVDLVLQNVSFVDTSYYAVGSWVGPAAEPSDGALRINHASRITVKDCSFLPGLSGYGVVIGNRSSDVVVTGSHFEGLGEGGVLMYGVSSNRDFENEPPRNNRVTHCTFHDLGKTLVHVAAVSLRASSGNVISHNRITTMPRYALEADSFYNLSAPGGRISRDNLFEYNVIDDVCYATTDTGAIEMLGSGDASLVGWQLNNTLRYNKVTNVRGSSSSDGMHVCQGQAVNETLGCRGITWAVYLDGAYSGAQIYGNIFDGSSKGAMIINGGSSINFTNNIVLSAKTYNIELNFCYKSNNSLQEKRVTSWPGNSFARNIFSWNSTRPDSAVFGIPGPPNGPPCVWVPHRVSMSDYNLYHNSQLDMATAGLFPGGLTLAGWQKGNKSRAMDLLAAVEGTVPDDRPPFGYPPRDAHSIVEEPGFIGDPYEGRLSPSSPAITRLGFQPLPDIEAAAPSRWRRP